MFEFEKLPTGRARELSKFAQENWQEHLLLFSQVKNRVLEVNPHINIPLKLEKGKSSPLGLFAEAAFKEKPSQGLPEGKRALEFWPEHGRSALLGRVLFSDNEGRIYRDIDLKGVGFLDKDWKTARVRSPGAKYPFSADRMGLLDVSSALFDRQMSEKFLKAGIRTSRVLATIGLKELIMNGKKLSLEKAIESDIIDKNFLPAVEVRAFGTKARVSDFLPGDRGNLLLEDAKQIVSQELGLKECLSNEQYVEWFAETLGKNIGLMHKNGWRHNHLFSHNITLDCRIIDLDSVTQYISEEQPSRYNMDLENAKKSIEDLMRWLYPQQKTEHCLELFKKSYDLAKVSKSKQKERTE